MMRAIIRRLRRDDAGLGMTELLIAMMLTLGIMAMVGTMFIQTSRITIASNSTTQLNGAASNVVNEATSVLRMATTLAKSNTTPDPAIVSGSRSVLTLYSFSNTTPQNPAPVRVTITLTGTSATAGTVTEDRCTATQSGGYWTFGACAATSTRVLATGVLLPATGINPLFTYRDVNGTAMAIGTGNLTDANRAAVGSITVEVATRAQTSTAAPIVITNTVVLRNLGLDPIS